MFLQSWKLFVYTNVKSKAFLIYKQERHFSIECTISEMDSLKYAFLIILILLLTSIVHVVRIETHYVSVVYHKQILINKPNKTNILIIVPYRDRHVHLTRFIAHMDTYFKNHTSLALVEPYIWVVEQDDFHPFNRGWLTNVGIDSALKYFGGDKFDCIIQHDVDRFPVSLVNYEDCIEGPIHLASENEQWKGSVPYSNYVGGIISMTPTHWLTINGMSNLYRGWGGEDDDLWYRLRATKLLLNSTSRHASIRRPMRGYGRFAEWHDKFHTERDMSAHRTATQLVTSMKHGSTRWKRDGLNSLAYDLVRLKQVQRRTYVLWVKDHNVAQRNVIYAALGGDYANRMESVEDLIYSARAVVGGAERVTIKLFTRERVKNKEFVDFARRMSVRFVKCPKLDKPYASTRFSCYLKELEREDPTSKIALLDTNDVVLLRDVFENITGPVHLVQEPSYFKIEKCPYHKRWITRCKPYGWKMFLRIKENPMICAGTIFGHVAGVRKLLGALNARIEKDRCNDQGLLNILVYGGLLGFTPSFWTHESGPVLSLNVARSLDLRNASLAHTGDNPKAVELLKNRPERVFRDVLSTEESSESSALLKQLDKILTKHNISYVVDGGTLVGTVQLGKRIPWDDDMDIYVMKADEKRLMNLIQQTYTHLRFLPSYNGLYYKIWNNKSKPVANGQAHNWPFVDVGILDSNSTHVWEQRTKELKYSRHVYPKEWMLPSRRMVYEGFPVNVPQKSLDFLRYRFGSNWDKRCVYANWNHKLERIRNKALGDGNRKITTACTNIRWLVINIL